jgi:hypothetical protein
MSAQARASCWELLHAAVHQSIVDLSGLSDVATVTLYANRESTSVARTVGDLAGKLVVRSRPDAARTVADRIGQIRGSTADALDAASVPWIRLVDAMLPHAFASHAGQPYISFNPSVQPAPSAAGQPAFRDCTTTPFTLALRGTPDPAISIVAVQREGSIDVDLHYRTDWYDRDAVQEFWSTVEENLDRWAR